MFGETEYDWHIDFNTFTLQMGLKLPKFFNPDKATNVIIILTPPTTTNGMPHDLT